MLSLNEIAEKHKISIIYLFGSQAETGKKYLEGEKLTPERYSDLDVAVLFEKIPENPIKTYGELYKDLCIF